MVNLTIDAQKVTAEPGRSVLEVCRQSGLKIPALCYHPALPAYGACRLCLVEVEERGRSKITASCLFPAREGLVVRTDTDRVVKRRRIMAELLLARCPNSTKVQAVAAELGVTESRFPKKNEDCILCGLCTRVCSELMKTGAIDFVGRGNRRKVQPAYDKRSPICMACGACQVVCPTGAILLDKTSTREPRPILAEFDAGLAGRPSIYIPYPQAIPKAAVIDRETCVHFGKAEGLDACKACQYFCQAGAIDYNQREELVDLDVGAVVISPGFELCDHTLRAEYGFGQYPNVISSLQFERVLSASGPYQGIVRRPSDGREPKRIASIQCVGSREEEANYCSSVCCMYAVKHALMAKEHLGEVEYTVFFMDLRAFGKGFDAYYQRALDQGVRFVRARPATVEEVGEGRNLRIKYLNERGEFKDEQFDLVVLSTGMRSVTRAVGLAQRLGVETDENGYCRTRALEPLESSRPGIMVCGTFAEPKDIPETVMQASGAAARAMAMLAEARGTLIQPKQYPPEREVSAEEPRIGVFVCHCGRNIGAVVNVPEVVEYARSLPNVVYAEENLYTCSTDSQAKMRQAIEEHRLNRVVVASCTPRTHEPLFRDTLREAELNPYLFEMANIRNQCSWVHSDDWEAATRKAKELVRMAVGRAVWLRPLYTAPMPTEKAALVIGGGAAGMTASLSLAQQGFRVHLVERSDALGGNLRHLYYAPEDTLARAGLPQPQRLKQCGPQGFMATLMREVLEHPLITTHMATEVSKTEGFVGKFTSTLQPHNGGAFEVCHGATILATGGVEYRGPDYGYGNDARIITQQDFEALLASVAGVPDVESPSGMRRLPTSVAMILCVGPAEQYCGRICCTTALKNALLLKRLFPPADITVIYRDIRTYGFKERLYTEARRAGIRFVHYEPDRKPEVVCSVDGLNIQVWEEVLGQRLTLKPDLLVLSMPVVPPDGVRQLSSQLKLPLDMDGFFMEAHVKLRPVDFSSDGFYMAGMANYPKLLQEVVVEARAAAARAATILAQDAMQIGGSVAVVDQARCAGCLTCVRTCPYGAPHIVADLGGAGGILGAAQVEAVACHGCGSCAVACPAGAIQLMHYTDAQVLSKVRGLFGEVIALPRGDLYEPASILAGPLQAREVSGSGSDRDAA